MMLSEAINKKAKDHSQGNQYRKEMINTFIYLQFQWWKAILFGAPMIFSIFGIYFLTNYTQLRSKVFYSHTQKFIEGSTTHILLENEENVKVILPIYTDCYQNKKYFYCELEHKKLILKDDNCIRSVDLSHEEIQLQINKGLLNLENGLGIFEAQQRQRYYGKNEHKLQPPNYFFYIFSVMTEPIFLLQYITYIIWVAYGYQFISAFQFVISFVVVTFNYFILRNNFNDVREIAQHHGKTRVIRDGKENEINNSEIVVGDLFYLDSQIPCDSVIVRGEATVNEANLTGQNIPIWKIQQDPQKLSKNIQWIYEGSQIVSAKNDTIALALRVGFSSRKGSMLKQILGQSTQQPKFFKKIIIFFLMNFLLALVAFQVITNFIIQDDQTKKEIRQKFFLFITYCFPTSLTTMSAFVASMAIIRMKRKSIIGKDISKCFDGSQIKSIYFDKTGTLTESHVNLADIYGLNEQSQLIKLQNIFSGTLFSQLFSSCHSISSRNGQLLGDQIDLQMFKASSCIKIETTKQAKAIIQGNGFSIQILKLFQFQSKNQSMAVIVKIFPKNEYFVFSKGSPELIQKYSKNEVKGFNNLLKRMSLEGFRSIAFGYRQFSFDELAYELENDQQELIRNLNFLGIASFANKIKVEAKEAVRKLKQEVGIQQKMLTGDNIYVAVQAAYSTGIINDNQSCLICQEQNKKDQKVKLIQIQKKERSFQEREIIISQSQIKGYLSQYQSQFRTLAMDYQFYTQYGFSPNDNIRIFSRVKPEGKAAIIKIHMTSLQLKQSQKSALNLLLSDYRQNICMVGDGANDLLAIKESDVGISMQIGVGSARADFTITSLSQIQEIIKEGKNITQIFMEYSQIISLILLLNIPTFFQLTKEHSNISTQVTIFRSFYYFGLLHIVFPLSIPSLNTHRIPNTNTLKSYFQLKFWGSYFLSAFATLLCFELYFDIEGIHPSQANNLNTQLAYYDFFLQNIKSLFVLITNYKSNPWKQPIFNNCLLFIAIIANSLFIIGGIFADFSIPSLGFFHISTIVKIGFLVIFSLFGFLIFMWVQFLDYIYEENLEETSLISDS